MPTATPHSEESLYPPGYPYTGDVRFTFSISARTANDIAEYIAQVRRHHAARKGYAVPRGWRARFLRDLFDLAVETKIRPVLEGKEPLRF